MILLSVDKISKSFSEKTLLQDVSLYLSDTDKVGVIGINGTCVFVKRKIPHAL